MKFSSNLIRVISGVKVIHASIFFLNVVMATARYASQRRDLGHGLLLYLGYMNAT